MTLAEMIQERIEELDRERVRHHLGAKALELSEDDLADAWDRYYIGDDAEGESNWGWEAEVEWEHIEGQIVGLQWVLSALNCEEVR